MNNDASISKRFKFLDGPFKGLVFTVLSYSAGTSMVRFASYDRKEIITEQLAKDWGWKEV